MRENSKKYYRFVSLLEFLSAFGIIWKVDTANKEAYYYSVDTQEKADANKILSISMHYPAIKEIYYQTADNYLSGPEVNKVMLELYYHATTLCNVELPIKNQPTSWSEFYTELEKLTNCTPQIVDGLLRFKNRKTEEIVKIWQIPYLIEAHRKTTPKEKATNFLIKGVMRRLRIRNNDDI